ESAVFERATQMRRNSARPRGLGVGALAKSVACAPLLAATALCSAPKGRNSGRRISKVKRVIHRQGGKTTYHGEGKIMTHKLIALAVGVSTMALAGAAGAQTLVYCSEGSPEGFAPALYAAGTTFDASAETIFDGLV